MFAGSANSNSDECLPKTLKEAYSGAEAELWKSAVEEELLSLNSNHVYETVLIPEGITPITSKPVFRIKRDQYGNVKRYKVQIVARGLEVFAPVANLDSVRTLIALAAKHNLELDQMDVSTAYLNGELEEDLYMLPPDGVSIQPGYCWKLQRSLYGLKQAGRTWNKTLDRKLGKLGFTRLDAETCLYVFRKDGQVCFLVVYVDDLLLAAITRKFMDSIKAKLSASFKMRDLGEAKYILGIEIKRNRKFQSISLSQSQYSRTILEHTGMSTCKSVWTPMAHNSQLSVTDPEDDRIIPEQIIEGCQVSYLTVIGSLMYLMLGMLRLTRVEANVDLKSNGKGVLEGRLQEQGCWGLPQQLLAMIGCLGSSRTKVTRERTLKSSAKTQRGSRTREDQVDSS